MSADALHVTMPACIAYLLWLPNASLRQCKSVPPTLLQRWATTLQTTVRRVCMCHLTAFVNRTLQQHAGVDAHVLVLAAFETAGAVLCSPPVAGSRG